MLSATCDRAAELAGPRDRPGPFDRKAVLQCHRRGHRPLAGGLRPRRTDAGGRCTGTALGAEDGSLRLRRQRSGQDRADDRSRGGLGRDERFAGDPGELCRFRPRGFGHRSAWRRRQGRAASTWWKIGTAITFWTRPSRRRRSRPSWPPRPRRSPFGRPRRWNWSAYWRSSCSSPEMDSCWPTKWHLARITPAIGPSMPASPINSSNSSAPSAAFHWAAPSAIPTR